MDIQIVGLELHRGSPGHCAMLSSMRMRAIRRRLQFGSCQPDACRPLGVSIRGLRKTVNVCDGRLDGRWYYHEFRRRSQDLWFLEENFTLVFNLFNWVFVWCCNIYRQKLHTNEHAAISFPVVSRIERNPVAGAVSIRKAGESETCRRCWHGMIRSIRSPPDLSDWTTATSTIGKARASWRRQVQEHDGFMGYLGD